MPNWQVVESVVELITTDWQVGVITEQLETNNIALNIENIFECLNSDIMIFKLNKGNIFMLIFH